MSRFDAGDDGAVGGDGERPPSGDRGRDDDAPYGDLRFEEFACEPHRIVAIRDDTDETRWIQSTVAAPVEP